MVICTMKYRVSFVCCCILIALFKIPDTAGLYLTDGNNYLLYAKLLGQGKLLYKDIYLDNFPLMMYISVVYRWLTFGSMQFFNYTATVEKKCISGLIYYLVLRKWKSHSTGFLDGITFLGSYSVMASSFQLGFFTDVLLLMLVYMCVERKKLIIAGILSACAVLVKAYSVFIVFGLFIYIIQRYRVEVWKYVVAALGTLLVSLFLIFYKDVYFACSV